MNRLIARTIIVIMMIFGLGMISYPKISNFLNERNQSKIISNYVEEVESLSIQQKTQALTEAKAFNTELAKDSSSSPGRYSKSLSEKYRKVLNLSETQVIGYIVIPSLGINLSIYHGTEESALSVGVGHLEGTSIPIGGESTHAVLSGHTGLPSAELFTNIDQLVEGDVITLHILDDVLTYEVDQIKIVLPSEVDDLRIVEGEDLVTLVTCTPYGVNSHRLLIRGRRIPTVYTEEEEETIVEAITGFVISPTFLIIGGIGIGTILLIVFIKFKQKKDDENHPMLPPLPPRRGRRLPPRVPRQLPSLPGQIRR